jgi:membrane protease YdiL (CAAX protease family)
MKKIIEFLRKERLYILILIFVLLFNAVGLLYSHDRSKAGKAPGATAEQRRQAYEKEISDNKTLMEESMRSNPRLALLFGLASMLILAVLLLGIVLDILITSAAVRGSLDIRSLSPPPAGWTLWDAFKVVMLFLFFGYIMVLSEAFLSRVVPALKSENIRMILNTSVLDVVAVILVIYFAVTQYKNRIEALGLSLKNVFKNIFYGLAGYIALVPVLVLILAATAVVINITKYIPAKQPVVELLLKEKDTAFLAYSSLFAAIAGPFVEELFFRGFLYGALKRYISVFWSMLVTAALFAALHTHVVGFLPIMALGVLLAYLYEKTGTLVSSITVHIAHNLSMVFLVFLIKQAGS